ncbi:DNA/RNA non-specific endonuclease [Limosilactobacillus difficilis]|uniref:DNA/RNA non-specific endonuclease n=1 Tax=Limosilactobacillus difficilis TaxID=2991838 RepID=UPI0024BAD5CE|nr:DNA/RNA non-specific endonuclease [Limosilactobacillus difficilis]
MRKFRRRGWLSRHWLIPLVVLLFAFLNLGGQSRLSQALAWTRSGYWHQTTQRAVRQPPTQQQADAVLTPTVKKQLGSSIQWNNAGAFIVNNNRTKLNANTNAAPWAVNHLDAQGRPWQGDAWLNKTTRQYQNRAVTGNGASSWKPAGFLQATNLTGGYSHAYDRGHLLGYALVGGLRGFNASESNPNNIAAQTAWANEAGSAASTGQNYYEGLVRQALDRGKNVRYRVTDIYDGNNLVPAGAHIEAKSSDGSLQFNCFVPNVQRNISINYATGAVTQR